jgi:hypothetical protein
MEPFLCLGANEIANVNRVTAYGAHKLFEPCQCPVLADEVYTDPATDDAPWYDADHPESVNFLGFLPSSIVVGEPGGRSTTGLAAVGAQVGSEHLVGRIVDVQGWMIATDQQSQYWGQRWLTEALRGSPCEEGCAADDLTLLPFCRENGTEADFRKLVGAGKVAGPRFSSLLDDECFVITEVQFQMGSSMPWLYHPAQECLVADSANEGLVCSLTTPQWVESGTYLIEITNTDIVATTDITITGTISLDGSCPITGAGTSVAPSWSYTIPTLGAHDRIVIDGLRRQVLYYDASSRQAAPGLGYVTFEGPWVWPDVGFCTTVCLSIEASGGEAVANVSTSLREL